MIEIVDSELRPADHVVVAFTGVQHRLGDIPLEFYRSLGEIDCAPLFVRDMGQRWYQYEAKVVDGVAQAIRDAARRAGARRLICLGNSMGGFGALLFGSIIGADAILAVGAQSGISPDVMEEVGDRRYRQFLTGVAAFPFGDLLKLEPAKGQVTLCYGADNRPDCAHAARLLRSWTAESMPVPRAGHNAAKVLRERGELIPLIRSVVEGTGRPLLPR